ncbi:MAG: hypothetical protein HYS66_06815 [Deltaproteobacteria bacterium]|nr:hypothetical protein [Deltaproteobacteria bacterium]
MAIPRAISGATITTESGRGITGGEILILGGGSAEGADDADLAGVDGVDAGAQPHGDHKDDDGWQKAPQPERGPGAADPARRPGEPLAQDSPEILELSASWTLLPGKGQA